MLLLLQKLIQKSIENIAVILIAASFLAFAWHFLFRRKKLFLAGLMVALSALVLSFYGGLADWVIGLGGDSFIEASSFDLAEARFWMSSFVASLFQMVAPRKLIVVFAVQALLLSVLMYRIIRWQPVALRLFVVGLFAGHAGFFYTGYLSFEEGRAEVASLEEKFRQDPTGFSTQEDIDLLLYIGESTSTLSMSLYGYPMPTTPKLDALFRKGDGFLRFDKVRSSSTHTSPSLLRALAVTSPQRNGEINHWGIANVLASAGLKPQLLSVQPLNGSFANFSKYIFEGAALEMSEDDRYLGNLAKPKLKDHQVLQDALAKPGVVLFHSYAGHGDYLQLIDMARSQPVPKPDIDFNGVFGTALSEVFNKGLPAELASYEQALTYIDGNVAEAVENIRQRTKPAVLVYFSDHGEAVFTHRGHESSKFVDEMSTVPLVIYFNAAYRSKYPHVFAQYQKAADEKRVRILDQVASTVLDVLRVESTLPLDVPTLASHDRHPRPYILQRSTMSGDSRINLDYDEASGFSNALFSGGSPEPTYIAILNERFGGDNAICYHRANSFAKALRGAAVTNCLEFDLTVDDGQLSVRHPPAVATGFNIAHIFDIAQARKSKLWIDSKNLEDADACRALLQYLEANHQRVGQILVEFPSAAVDQLDSLGACVQGLRALGAKTSYYIPIELMAPCVEDAVKHASICAALDARVKKVMASGLFTDLSFDFVGYPLIKQIEGARDFKWNTWAIRASDFHRFPREEFDFVIMDTSTDPNPY